MKKFLSPVLLIAMFSATYFCSAMNGNGATLATIPGEEEKSALPQGNQRRNIGPEYSDDIGAAVARLPHGEMPPEFPGDPYDLCIDDNSAAAVAQVQTQEKPFCFGASHSFIAEEDWLGVEHCNQIESLDFSRCQINARRFQLMLERCGRKFKSISFSQCTGNNNDDAVYRIAHNCPNLETINLCGCNNIMPDALICLVKSCQKLRYISLPRVNDDLLVVMANHELKFEEINLSGCSGFSEDALIDLLAACGPQLRLLDISNCSVISSKRLYGPLTDRTLDVLLAKCQNLESLDISCCDGFTEAKLIKYLSICGPRLRFLSLFHCRCVTDHVLEAIAQCCPNLAKLDLRHCSSLLYNGIDMVRGRLPHTTIIRPDLVVLPGN